MRSDKFARLLFGLNPKKYKSVRRLAFKNLENGVCLRERKTRRTGKAFYEALLRERNSFIFELRKAYRAEASLFENAEEFTIFAEHVSSGKRRR